MNRNQLPSWREKPAKQSIVDFATAVTTPDSADYVQEAQRVAVFDNDGIPALRLPDGRDHPLADVSFIADLTFVGEPDRH